MQSLSLEADDISKDMVANAVMKYADSESHVEEILRILYIRILLDWKYARHMAYICAKLVKIPNLGMKFRASLVRRIQSDFNSKCHYYTQLTPSPTCNELCKGTFTMSERESEFFSLILSLLNVNIKLDSL